MLRDVLSIQSQTDPFVLPEALDIIAVSPLFYNEQSIAEHDRFCKKQDNLFAFPM